MLRSLPCIYAVVIVSSSGGLGVVHATCDMDNTSRQRASVPLLTSLRGGCCLPSARRACSGRVWSASWMLRVATSVVGLAVSCYKPGGSMSIQNRAASSTPQAQVALLIAYASQCFSPIHVHIIN